MMRHILLLDGTVTATIQDSVLRMEITVHEPITKRPSCTIRKRRCPDFATALRSLTALEEILNGASGAFTTELLTRMHFTSEFGVVQPLKKGK